MHDPGAAEHELNGFLASHRVLSVDRRFVEEGERSFWSFCVDFVDARRGLPSSSAAGSPGSATGPTTAGAQLRGFRGSPRGARFARPSPQAEGVPVYTIFTNEQLAQIAQAAIRN